MKVIGIYNKSVLLTYVGILVSLLGIMNIVLVNGSENNTMICLVIAGICDLFDGKIARMCKRNEIEKKFGIQIDSLADVISFLVFPTIYLLSKYGEKFNIYIFIITVSYILCGIIRLAWFNITTEATKDNTYRGLPVTYVALILPSIYTIFKVAAISYFEVVVPFIYFVIGAFFVIDIRIKKPTGIWYGIFSILAIVIVIILVLDIGV